MMIEKGIFSSPESATYLCMALTITQFTEAIEASFRKSNLQKEIFQIYKLQER